MQNPFKNLNLRDKAAAVLRGSGKMNPLGFAGIILGLIIIYVSFEMVSVPMVKECREPLFIIIGVVVLTAGVFFTKK